MMWIIRKYLDRYRAWRRAREDYVIAQAMLLGANIQPYLSNNDARYHNAARWAWVRYPPVYYRAFAPVHGEMGEVTVYGKTVYECAKKWMAVQELTL